MLNDEQIFDILDGCAPEDVLAQHTDLMKHSVAYQKYFQELEAMHLDLVGLSLEKPSADFTEKVIEAIPAPMGAVIVQRKKTWSTKMMYVLAAMFVLCLGFTIGLALLYKPSDAAGGGMVVPFIKEFSDFFAKDFIKIAGLLNLILLLIVFDKRVLQLYFSQKRITLG